MRCWRMVPSNCRHYFLVVSQKTFAPFVWSKGSEEDCEEHIVTETVREEESEKASSLIGRPPYFSTTRVMATYSGRHDRTVSAGLALWLLQKFPDVLGLKGTWQFMSAALLRSPGRMHELKDDIESSCMSLDGLRCLTSRVRWVKMNNAALGRQEGGSYKAFQLTWGAYPGEGFKLTEHRPMLELIRDLAWPFRARYGKPPTEEHQKRFEFLMPQYRLSVEQLSSPEWFLRTFEEALESPGWPAKDGAGDSRIAFIDGPARQRQPPAPRIKARKAVPQRVPATPPPPAPQEKRSDLDDNSDEGIIRG
ncbi:hypothetical protein EDD15DRAFT_2203603 [Pisolithus albus]|nr:hypothetical protein EDD15DRAFT_2203603 [Pisolithus albus]